MNWFIVNADGDKIVYLLNTTIVNNRVDFKLGMHSMQNLEKICFMKHNLVKIAFLKLNLKFLNIKTSLSAFITICQVLL